MIYTATITSASLRVRECRIVADLLLAQVNSDEWKQALYEENRLQMGSIESVKRISRLLRARIEPLGPDLWRMLRDGSRDLAIQVAFACAVKQSRLLGDFMDITMREHRALFAKKLDNGMWNEYLQGCRGRDPEMPVWSDATMTKLRSAVFTMLAEAGYVKDTRSLLIQNVFVDDQLVACLRDRGESYILRCMEVTL